MTLFSVHQIVPLDQRSSLGHGKCVVVRATEVVASVIGQDLRLELGTDASRGEDGMARLDLHWTVKLFCNISRVFRPGPL